MIAQTPKLTALPKSLPIEDAVRIELQEGVPVFKASSALQKRIEGLLAKQRKNKLSKKEDHELCVYEELDDYLSFANRIIRNMLIGASPQTHAA